MAYNITNLSGAADMAQLGSSINLLSGGILGIAILLIVFFITFMAWNSQIPDIRKVLLYSFTVCTIISIPLLILGWLAFSTVMTCIVLTAGMLLWVYLGGKD